ncbi:MAG: DUF2723 domain-containing protein, partial [bacterium]
MATTAAPLATTPPDTPAPSRPPVDWYPWVAFLAPLILFISTACRVLYVGDAGDFATACWTLGMPHPPGYPLYTLLGWLVCRLPIPGSETEVAWRLNLMSGFFAAGACYFAYLILERLGRVKSLALIGALAIAVSRGFWTQSTITEVYSLHIFFIMVLWWQAIRFAETGSRKWWQYWLLTASLSLAHHYSILMFFPFMWGYVWFLRRSLVPVELQSDGTPRQHNLVAEIFVAFALIALPMTAFYCYLPAIHYRTPIAASHPMHFEDENGKYSWQKEFDYAVNETILRGVYANKAKFEGATTTPQVVDTYLKYVVGDPFHANDAFSSGDQGTLALFFLLALYMAFFWHPKVPEDLPKELRAPANLGHILLLLRCFLASLLLFFCVITLYPSGDILNAPQTNLKVVMPPLLVPGHLFLVLAIFAGCAMAWHGLAYYVWNARAKDPMPPVQKLAKMRQLFVGALAALVLVNCYNNWPDGDRSRSYIAWLYAVDVYRSVAPDTVVINTGDETFLYWYLTNVHLPMHPEQAKPGIEFTNWIHQIPSYEALASKTEAELQRDVIVYFLKQQLAERAKRALNAVSDTEHPLHFDTTFFRPEFKEVEFFRYWDVSMDGLVYHWEPKPDYEVIAVQDVIQTNSTVAPDDRISDSSIQLLQTYMNHLLYLQSPAFAARWNADHNQPLNAGAAEHVDPAMAGPIHQNPDGTWVGVTPVHDPSDTRALILTDDRGQPVFSVPDLAPLEVTMIDRDWWTFYDWRGILDVRTVGDKAEVNPSGVAYDAQE